MSRVISLRPECRAARLRAFGRPRRLHLTLNLVGEQHVDVPEIDTAETVRQRAEGVPVIDVREPGEYVEGHVAGAVLIPLATVPDRLGDIPTEGPVLIICRSGARSRNAAQFLRTQGIDAINVGGGIIDWIHAGHPVATGDDPGSDA